MDWGPVQGLGCCRPQAGSVVGTGVSGQWGGYCRASDGPPDAIPLVVFSSLSPSLPGPALHTVVSSSCPLSTIGRRPPSPCLKSMDASRPPRRDACGCGHFPWAYPRRTEEQNSRTERMASCWAGLGHGYTVRHCCRRHHGSTHRAGYPPSRMGKDSSNPTRNHQS
jgi:hypothetical protein